MGNNLPEQKINIGLTIKEWHARFLQQASWTLELRKKLFSIPIGPTERILEVGCGTGAVLGDQSRYRLSIGMDIQREMLLFARKQLPSSPFVQADAATLPFHTAAFDISFCHFLLLWVDSPLKVLKEMRRVTRPGGIVAAFAEPDHAARIDHPPELIELGKIQTHGLQQRGADISCGRKLVGWIHACDLENTQVGMLSWKKADKFDSKDWELEWKVMKADCLFDEKVKSKLETLRKVDKEAWIKQERVLYVPTFFAYGFVPA
jgi:SAM-dependent methyltransferase